MVGDAVIEEAGPDTVTPGGAQTLIKGDPLHQHFRKNRGVKSYGDTPTSTEPASASDDDATTAAPAEGTDDEKDKPFNLMQGHVVQTRPDTPGVRVAFEMSLTPADVAPAQGGNVAYLAAIPVLQRLLAEHDPEQPFAAPVDNVALRLALATVNGSWLWRNRTLASTVRIRVAWQAYGPDGTSEQDELLVPNVRTWPADPAKILPGGRLDDPYGHVAAVAGLARVMAQTLRGERLVLRCFVEAWLDVPASTRVFPSQLRTEKKENRAYFELPMGGGHFALTAEKVANKLRTIDAWHGDPRFPDTSIPVEIFGSSLEYGFDIRDKHDGLPDRSLLVIWKKLIQKAHVPANTGPEALAAAQAAVARTLKDQLTLDEKFFLVAWFLRGGAGVYMSEETKLKKAAAKAEKAEKAAKAAKTKAAKAAAKAAAAATSPEATA